MQITQFTLFGSIGRIWKYNRSSPRYTPNSSPRLDYVSGPLEPFSQARRTRTTASYDCGGPIGPISMVSRSFKQATVRAGTGNPVRFSRCGPSVEGRGEKNWAGWFWFRVVRLAFLILAIRLVSNLRTTSPKEILTLNSTFRSKREREKRTTT